MQRTYEEKIAVAQCTLRAMFIQRSYALIDDHMRSFNEENNNNINKKELEADRLCVRAVTNDGTYVLALSADLAQYSDAARRRAREALDAGFGRTEAALLTMTVIARAIRYAASMHNAPTCTPLLLVLIRTSARNVRVRRDVLMFIARINATAKGLHLLLKLSKKNNILTFYYFITVSYTHLTLPTILLV